MGLAQRGAGHASLGNLWHGPSAREIGIHQQDADATLKSRPHYRITSGTLKRDSKRKWRKFSTCDSFSEGNLETCSKLINESRLQRCGFGWFESRGHWPRLVLISRHWR